MVRSRIARLIFLGNLLGMLILTIGALVLSELRAQLIEAQIASLRTQGELVRNVLAETATIGDPEPGLVGQRARQVVLALRVPPSTRLRLFDARGGLVADTNVLADRVIERELPGLPGQEPTGLGDRIARRAEEAAARIAALRLAPWTPDFTQEEERARAVTGVHVAGQRKGDQGQRLISVSMPIQRVEAVVGVLTLESGDVDEILQAERRAMAPFILGAVLVWALSSSLLAFAIARPLRRLAVAADQLRRTGATRLQLPDVRARKDEIGDLANALERMTGALADRIAANERFAADVSHEIKNPLTSIRSAVETVRAVNDEDRRERLLGIIAADVGRLDRLITDIARASRLEAEAALGEAERVDLGRFLADIAETYASLREDGAPAVSFNGPPPPGAVVLGQAGPLGQVFRNLIDNARSFSPPQGLVSVSVSVLRRREGSVVRAEVADQGPGIPPANLETVFRRFYTDRPKGTAFGANSGLGLSIAREIVEAHKGRIWAENIPGLQEDSPLGARFVVELPAARGGPDRET